MKTLSTLLATAFLSSTLLHAEPADLTAQLDAIRNLLKPAEADTPETKAAKAQYKNLPNTWQRMLDSDQLAVSSGNGLREMGYDLSAVPGLAEKADAFMQSAKQEAERKEAAEITEAEALLTQIGEQLKNAKKPEDLDDLIQKLNKNKIPDYGSNPKLSALSRDLQSTLQITTQWQSYLMAVEAGKNSESRQSLQQISSSLTSTPIIPRSYVLRLLNSVIPDPTDRSGDERNQIRISINEAIARLTDTGDIEAAMAELKGFINTLAPGSENYYTFLAIVAASDLRKLEPSMSEAEVLANYKSGIPNTTDQYHYYLTRAYNQTLLNSIARSYGIETPSAKTTTPQKVLETIATNARDKQDWPKLRQALTSMTNLSITDPYNRNPPKYANDLTITALLIIAEKAEKEGDFTAAAAAYLEASTLDGIYLHRDLVDPKSALIRKNHPEAFPTAMQRAEEKQALAETARKATETARKTADEEMHRQPTMPVNRNQQLEVFRPIVQEVVADFLKKKRSEAEKPAEPETKPRKAPKKQ